MTTIRDPEARVMSPVMALAAVAAFAAGWSDRGTTAAELELVMLAGAMGMTAAFFAYRLWVMRVDVSEWGVEVVNLLRSHRVPWNQIHAFEQREYPRRRVVGMIYGDGMRVKLRATGYEPRFDRSLRLLREQLAMYGSDDPSTGIALRNEASEDSG